MNLRKRITSSRLVSHNTSNRTIKHKCIAFWHLDTVEYAVRQCYGTAALSCSWSDDRTDAAGWRDGVQRSCRNSVILPARGYPLAFRDCASNFFANFSPKGFYDFASKVNRQNCLHF